MCRPSLVTRHSSLVIASIVTAVALATASANAVTMDAPGHVAVEGSAVTARGGEPGAAWTLVDWRGRPTGVGGVFGEDGAAVLPPLPCGYYRMVSARSTPPVASGDSPLLEGACIVGQSPLREGGGPERAGGSTAGTNLATLAVVAPPSLVTRHSSLVTNEPAQAGSFYGVDSALSWISSPGAFACPWNGGDTFRTVSDLIALAGLPHVRDRLSWSGVNPKPGVFDYGLYMRNADLLHERGTLISGMFHDAPEWAGRIRRLPSNLNAVYDFCAATAAAFGDRMGDWEFWNEEDIGFAPEPAWDYAAALKAAYLGFKAGRPGLTVLPGALCQQPDAPYARALFDNDAAKFGDVFNYHTYAAPVRYPQMFATLRDFMARYGIGGRAVWLTECGTNLDGHSQKEGAKKGLMAHSPEQELVLAEFYPKSQIALQMEGVARNYYFVFGAYNEANGAKDWGVMRRDGTVKPGYAAISAMVREVGKARIEGELRVGEGLRAYLFAQPDGTQTVAFWSISPVDTATDGPVSATPEYTRELVLHLVELAAGTDKSHRVTEAQSKGEYHLSDMCGMASSVTATNGILTLHATRFPAYVSGLRGLVADVSPHPAGKVMPYEPTADEDLSVIIRVDLNAQDFEIGNQKTLASLKGDTGRLRVQVWNMGDTAKTGRVDVVGAKLEGLPEAIALGPRGTPPAMFDCELSPPGDSPDGELVLTGVFGGRRSSRLVMRIRSEKRFSDTCAATPIDWRNPEDWMRNDSAQSFRASWDESEQALRFDVAWTNLHADRWFYPVYKLKLPQESLEGAVALRFEVKCAQNKMENDFKEQNLMLLRADKSKPAIPFIPFNAPVGDWEKRYAEFSHVRDLADVTAFRLGANPCGTQCTFWIRNLEILRRNAFWRVSQDTNGVWWIVAPDGRDVFLRGIDHANWNGHYCEALKTNPYRDEMTKKFDGDRKAWEAETLSRLKDWGFNALGAGCSKELRGRGLVHIEFLAMGQAFCGKGGDYEISKFEGVPGSAFPNVFHPDFATFCDDRARKMCAPQKDDLSILGYFFDNELAWGAKGASSTGMFDAVAKMPPSHTARQALDVFLAERHLSGEAALNGGEIPYEIKLEFLRLAAKRYFEIIAAAIRRHDPNHLLLGARFAGLGSAHQVVWEEAGKICDILTFNNYPWADLDENVVYYSLRNGIKAVDAYALRYSWAKKPMIITEWSFPALDAGLPSSCGAGQRFRTQAERTQATELFARTLLALPFMVGYDYFMWVDEPALGISFKFPEDSNYGLVNERGEPYREITEMFTRINREAEALHARGKLPVTRPVDREAQKRAVKFPAPGGPGSVPAANASTFVRDGDAYTLTTGTGLVLKGRVGGHNAFDSVIANGIDYGRFTLMLFNGSYLDIDRVESAEWLAERGVLRVAGTGGSDRKSFRIVCDIVPFAARPWFAANAVSVENTGEEEFSDVKVFFRQYAPWATDWVKGGFRTPQNVWKAPASAAWIRSADGAWCGAATYAQTVRNFVYWISGDGAAHPDAMFSPVGSTRLAAGARWEPQGEVWMVAAVGTGGPDGWRRFLDDFTDTQAGGLDFGCQR